MPVEIQDVEVIAQSPSQPGPSSVQIPPSPPSTVLHPELQLEMERAAWIRRSRDLRLHAD
jgi:hypothetical protein